MLAKEISYPSLMIESLKIAATFTLVALVGCRSEHRATIAPIEDGVVWSPDGINVAAFLVSNDLENLVDGNRSGLSKDDLPLIAHVDMVTTAKQYEEDFDSNEIAADQKYRAKKILLYGTVTSINKDAMGDGYFTLASSNLFGVQAHLNDDGLERAASAKKGDKVALACDPGMRIIGFATLSNCLYLSQYMNAAHVSPDEQVRGFFTGRIAIPYSEFVGAIEGYALGVTPATPHSCISNPNTRTCDPATWGLDKTQLKQLWTAVGQKIISIRNGKQTFKRVSCNDSSHEIAGTNVAPSDACIMLRAAQ